MKKKELTTRQKNALKRHKSTHGHTKAHMDEMIKAMLAGKTFTEAHRLAMRKKGKLQSKEADILLLVLINQSVLLTIRVESHMPLS